MKLPSRRGQDQDPVRPASAAAEPPSSRFRIHTSLLTIVTPRAKSDPFSDGDADAVHLHPRDDRRDPPRIRLAGIRRRPRADARTERARKYGAFAVLHTCRRGSDELMRFSFLPSFLPSSPLPSFSSLARDRSLSPSSSSSSRPFAEIRKTSTPPSGALCRTAQSCSRERSK